MLELLGFHPTVTLSLNNLVVYPQSAVRQGVSDILFDRNVFVRPK